ncbi:MAG TPA: hypothetical protein VK608_02835 [Edaphobacter sp.]|nr:hypothetical protein [Edaphobacter sp.]
MKKMLSSTMSRHDGARWTTLPQNVKDILRVELDRISSGRSARRTTQTGKTSQETAERLTSTAARQEKVAYKYFWNMQKDPQGRFIGMMDGFTYGDPLCLAHEGTIEARPDPLATCEDLFHRYNADDARSPDYRGPSMSIGSVVEFSGEAYAVARQGFVKVDISGSKVAPADPRWRTA